MKWITLTEYEMVDEETGEIILKGKKPKNSIIIKKETKTTINENYGIKTIRYICRKDRQQKLWD